MVADTGRKAELGIRRASERDVVERFDDPHIIRKAEGAAISHSDALEAPGVAATQTLTVNKHALDGSSHQWRYVVVA